MDEFGGLYLVIKLIKIYQKLTYINVMSTYATIHNVIWDITIFET